MFRKLKHERKHSPLPRAELKTPEESKLKNGDIIDHPIYGIGIIMRPSKENIYLAQFEKEQHLVREQDISKSPINDLPKLQ